MSTFVYLLYDYEEYGPDNLRATIDPAVVPDLLERYIQAMDKEIEAGWGNGPKRYVPDWSKERAKLVKAMRDPKPGEYEIGDGWGCVTLMIAELQ